MTERYRKVLDWLARRESTVGWVAFYVLALVAGLWLYHAGSGLTFSNDDWSFVLYRQGSFRTIFEPHNNHIVVFPALIFKSLFYLVGLGHYNAYRAVGIAFHLLACFLVYVYGRKRIGAVAALAPVTVLLYLGTGAENLLWAFQLGLIGSIAMGLAALMLVDRRTLAARACCAGLLTLSLGMSEIGLSFLVAVFILLVARSDRRKDLWIVAIPGALYALWYIRYNTSPPFSYSNFAHMPAYVADEIAGAVGAVIGLGGAWSNVAAATLGFFVVQRLLRADRDNALLWALVLGGAAFWVPTALVRGSVASPDSSRYAYVGGFIIILMALELAAGVRLSGRAIGLLAFVTAAIVLANTPLLYHTRDILRGSTQYTRAELGAVEIARDTVSPSFTTTDIAHFPAGINAGVYLQAVDRYGSPAYTPAQISAAPDAVRVAADGVLVRAEPLRLELTPGAVAKHGSCRTVDPTESPRRYVVELPATGLLVKAGSASTQIGVRRFAQTGLTTPLKPLHPGEVATLTAVHDRVSLPWRIAITSKAAFVLCTPAGA